MKLIKIKLTEVRVGDRMRKEYGDLTDLKTAIQNGQLCHPPTVDSDMNLIAGGRRFEAHRQLGLEELEVNVRDGSTTPIELRMMELMENMDRLEMTWQEHVHAITEVHNLSETTAHLEAKKWSQARTGMLLGISHGKVGYCLWFSEVLKDEKHTYHKLVKEATSLKEAIRRVAEAKQDEAKRLLVAKSFGQVVAVRDEPKVNIEEFTALEGALTVPVNNGGPQTAETAPPPSKQSSETCVACEGLGVNSKGHECPICHGQPIKVVEDDIVIPLSKMLVRADFLEWAKSQVPESFHHCVSDPPYGIDVEMMKQDAGHGALRGIETTEKEHQVEANYDLLADAIPAIYRLIKPGGFCVLWTDEDTRDHVRDVGERAGFTFQRWSLVWVKTDVCKNDAAAFNFTKATEVAVVFRKGTATLVAPQPVNYKLCGHADRKVWKHPFAKPPELLEWVYRAIGHPGQKVIDPFMGCGTGVYAAAKVGLAPTGVDIVEQHYNEAVLNMMNAYRGWMLPRNVKFV